MAEFQGIFCCPFLPSVLIIEGVGGMNDRVGCGGVGGVGGGKKPHLGHFMSSHDAHTGANDTPVSYIASGSKYRPPLPNLCPPWVPLFQL